MWSGVQPSRSSAAASRDTRRLSGSWHQLVISGNGDRWRPAGVNAWLRELGVFGQRSFQKRIPASGLPAAGTSRSLSCFSTCGRQTARSRRDDRVGAVTRCTTRPPARDSQPTSQRCSCALASWRASGRAQKEGYRPSYHVRVSGADAQRLFLSTVGAFGPRAAGARALTEPCWLTSTAIPTLTRLPQGALPKRASHHGRARLVAPRDGEPARARPTVASAHFKFAPSRSTVLDYATVLGGRSTCAGQRPAISFGIAWWRSSRWETRKSSTSPCPGRPAGSLMAS